MDGPLESDPVERHGTDTWLWSNDYQSGGRASSGGDEHRRVFALTALALWDIKVHEGKNAVLKVAQHAKVMTAAVQLKRAREKEARNKKQ